MNKAIKISNNKLNISLLNLYIKLIKKRLHNLIIYSKLINNSYIIKPTSNSIKNLEILRFKLCKITYNIKNKDLKILYTLRSKYLLSSWSNFINDILNKYKFDFLRRDNVFTAKCNFHQLLFFISLMEKFELTEQI